MTNVTCLCRQRIEIDAGIVVEAPSPDFIGMHRYFVTVVDEEQERFGVWDGLHHEDAKAVAAHWSSVFGYPVIDRSGRQQ